MSVQKSPLLQVASVDFRKVYRAWEQFLAGREEGLEGVRPAILESWQRCRKQGVNPGLKKVPTVLPWDEVQRLREEKDIYRAALPAIRFLYEVLQSSYFAVMLADDRCRSLEVTGNPEVLGRAEQINGVLGADWCEEEVGTDACAVSCLLDMPMQVHWAEHYCEEWHKWTGNAAPIHHPLTREKIGTINIYGHKEIAHPRALELTIRAALMIERELYQEVLAKRLLLFEHYTSYLNKFPDKGIFGIDPKGIILIASPSAARIVGLLPEKTIGRSFLQLANLRTAGASLPSLDSMVDPCDFHWETEKGFSLRTTTFPVKSNQKISGFVAVLSDKGPSGKRVQTGSLWRASYTFADIIGKSAGLQACLEVAQKAAQQDLPLLLVGESGTGKELFAHAIHNASRRQESSFVPLNCGGMSEELVSAELFGYAEGAFTGAVRGGRAGKLELAQGGTLFLDEVEEMSPKMQVHLLRVLEEGRVIRVGAERPHPIDVRIIASTNADLEAKVREGRFRQDLYYRLNVLILSLPSLRDRKSDIPLLVKPILSSRGITKEVSPEALERLKAYCWPGNVRQLRNVLLQAADRAVGGMITEADLPSVIYSVSCCPVVCPFPYTEEEESSEKKETVLQKAEREAILRALRDCKGNISRAASQLGLHRVTLYRKMDKHGIRPERVWR